MAYLLKQSLPNFNPSWQRSWQLSLQTYQVVYTPKAVEDLERLFDLVLTRELNSPMAIRTFRLVSLKRLSVHASCWPTVRSAIEKWVTAHSCVNASSRLVARATWHCLKYVTTSKFWSVRSGINTKATTTEHSAGASGQPAHPETRCLLIRLGKPSTSVVIGGHPNL